MSSHCASDYVPTIGPNHFQSRTVVGIVTALPLVFRVVKKEHSYKLEPRRVAPSRTANLLPLCRKEVENR